MMEIEAERVEFLLEPSRADAEDHPAVREHVERGDLLGGIERMALRENQDAGRELDLRGDRRDKGERNQRIGNRNVLAAGNLAALRIGIGRLVALRDDDMFDRPERFDAALLRRDRQMRKQVGIAERAGIDEQQAYLHDTALLGRKD